MPASSSLNTSDPPIPVFEELADDVDTDADVDDVEVFERA
jgi:hypothetical protein